MKITYEIGQPSKEIERDYFKAYSWATFKDSLIIHQLLSVIENSDDKFDNLCAAIKEAYKNRTVKSRCDIYQTEDRLEITTKGVFPKIVVYKK